MVDNFRLTVDSNTEIEPLETVRDVRMKGQSLVDNRVATIPQMTGATSSSNGSAGVVPTPSVGDREKFLRGDGTWAETSSGGSNVSVDQILDDGVNIMDITIDNVTTHIYAPESDPNAVVDVEVNGVSVVTNNVAEITITESVTDVVDANGDSLVDANGVAHVTGEVVDVVNGDGDSLVDEYGVAHVTGDITDVVDSDNTTLVDQDGVAHISAKVTDVQFEGVSILDDNNVANIKTPFITFSAPTLDYNHAAYIDESSAWKDRNEHTWVAPCDCVIYACSPNSNTVKFTIGSFTYGTYKNMYGNYNNYVTSNLYTMLPVAKGTTVTIQFVGQIDTGTTYKKIRYIPFKEASSLQGYYLQPFLDYSNKITVPWEDPGSDGDLICEYTATVDGMLYLGLMYNTNQYPILKYNINNNTSINYIARGESLSNSVILSKGDTINIYDTGYASAYEYSGSLKFIPFERTNNLSNVVSPIPDYANMQILDTSSMPASFNAGYLFNCRYDSGNYEKQCNIELTNPQSDSIKLNSDANGTFMKQSLMPLNGTETFVSIQDLCNSGSVYFVPYATINAQPFIVSDVQVNGASVVDANGVAHITGSGGGSTVTVTPIQTTGTKIAEIDVDGVTSDLYAPNGGGGGSTVSVTQKVSSGENIASITVDGVATELYATNTTYSDFVGATSQAAGAHGLVPAPTTSDTVKFLKGDGSWGTPDSGSDVSVTQIQSTGTKIATVTVDGTDTDLYAPNGGGGGASELDDLDDVEITTPSNGQVLKYNSTTQKWENDSITFNTSDDLFGYISTLRVSDRYASASISNHSFNFNLNDYTDDWSTSATINNNTAIDITDYNSIEIDVTISEQADNGYLWITLSTTNYTWGGGEFPSIYKNVDSAIKISESGTYSVDVSELSGNYYIYIGGTSGKNSVTHASENNSLDGKIIGSVTEIRGVMETAIIPSIVANPEGEPTDTLNTIAIDGVIYDFAGGGGEKDYVKKRYIYTLTVGGAWQYFTDPQSDNPLLIEVVGGGAIRSYRVDADSLPTYESYTTIGTDIMGHAINMCKSSNGDIGISVNDPSISGETIKVYEVIGYSIEDDNIVKIYDSGSDTVPAPTNTEITYIDDIDISNYDLIMATYSLDRGSVPYPQTCYATALIDDVLNDSVNTWVVTGYASRWASLRINPTSFMVSASDGDRYGIYKLFAIKLGSSGSGNANMTELTQGEYNALTPAEKENGTMYLAHDGGYDFINYNDGEIIVRVNNNTDETLWFFNGYSKGTTEDVPVPSELTEYIPSWVRTVPDTYMQAKSWSDDTSTTQNGWVGFVNVAGTPMIRGWSVDFTTKVNISSWAVLDANGDHTQGGQTADYSDPYEGISISPNRIYLNGRKYAEVSDGNTLVGEQLTLPEYNQLSTAQKNDGSVRFIPHSDVGVAQAIDMTTQGFYEAPNNMNVTDTSSTKTTITWNGGIQIGCAYYYTTPVDVTDWESIILDIHTGSCYGGGSTAQNPSWDFIVGLLDYEITSAPNLPASSSAWKVVADLANSNYDYSNTTLNTSGLTGELYLTVICHGWNATVENVRLVNAGGNPSQIKYMGETYGIDKIHYSTREQIVGTWVDGSDIYEVTITNLSVTIASVAGWNTVDDVTDLDIDQVINATYILSSGITTKAQGTYVDSDDLKVYFTDFANDVINTAIIRYIKNTN